MCGIAGLLGTQPIATPEALAQAFDQALAHRGPDDAGLWHEDGVLLVHRRLAILDLSPDGHQPMASACGRWILVFNGEIYNYRELREHLITLGHRFHSGGDTEVLLQCLIRYGTAALDRLRGMYAFCLWDRQERRALLARDPFGIKPLYLHRGARGRLLFASEVRALLSSGLVPHHLDAQALRQCLLLGHLPAQSTLVAEVEALPPGHLALWQQGRLQIQPHWRASYAPEPPLAYPDLVAHTRSALETSVQQHRRADVPLGLFLSGGLDSSALLALSGGALRTLSIGFAERRFDEAARAEAIARAFGADHTSLQLTPCAVQRLLPAFLAAVDQPSVDGFNSFCVSQLASREGLKVVLSGLGGDELFGGYPSFQRLPRAMVWQRRWPGLRPPLAALLQRRPSGTAQRLAAGFRQPEGLSQSFAVLRGLFAPQEADRLLRHWELLPEGSGAAEHELPLLEEPCGEAFPTPQDGVAWLESSSYMGDQLLRDSDVFSMAWGLELRLPLVDSLLFRSLAAQPSRLRLQANKQLLRDAVPELQPLLRGSAKQGFVFPFRPWFDSPGPLRDQLQQLSPSAPPGLDLRPWGRRWLLMVLNQWLQQHLGTALP